MLLYLWLCVMQAFAPGADRVASLQTGAYEARLRADLETGALIGAAGHVARYTPLSARAI